MLRRLVSFSVLATLTLLFPLAGCNNAPSTPKATHAHDDHDHAEDPKTLAEAIAAIVKLRDTVRDGFAKNDTAHADEALHEVGHLFEQLPPLALKAGLSAEDAATFKQSTDELFDLFGKIDAKVHGKEGLTYTEASAKIDAAVERLQKIKTSK